MSKSFITPYGIALRAEGMIDVFPAVEAQFVTQRGDAISLFLLIDSGASLSALPKSDGEFLGINVEKGKVLYVGGIGGNTVRGWKHVLKIQLGGNEERIPVAFLDNQNAPRVLGREGVFEKFSILFEEGRRRTGFLVGKEGKSAARFLDKLRSDVSHE